MIRSSLSRFQTWRRRRRIIADGQAHPLTFARAGQRYRVVGIAGQEGFESDPCFACGTPDACSICRLMELGFCPGSDLEVQAKSGPLTVRLFGGRTALSRDLAHTIFVTPLPQAA